MLIHPSWYFYPFEFFDCSFLASAGYVWIIGLGFYIGEFAAKRHLYRIDEDERSPKGQATKFLYSCGTACAVMLPTVFMLKNMMESFCVMYPFRSLGAHLPSMRQPAFFLEVAPPWRGAFSTRITLSSDPPLVWQTAGSSSIDLGATTRIDLGSSISGVHHQNGGIVTGKWIVSAATLAGSAGRNTDRTSNAPCARTSFFLSRDEYSLGMASAQEKEGNLLASFWSRVVAGGGSRTAGDASREGFCGKADWPGGVPKMHGTLDGVRERGGPDFL